MVCCGELLVILWLSCSHTGIDLLQLLKRDSRKIAPCTVFSVLPTNDGRPALSGYGSNEEEMSEPHH
jgi:hypothetical protein